MVVNLVLRPLTKRPCFIMSALPAAPDSTDDGTAMTH
jgi:hypothetical protein